MALKKGRIQKIWGFLTSVLEIPDVTATGASGRGTGFTTAQAEKISPTTNGVPLSRAVFNQVLGETQIAAQDIQNHGAPAWYSNADNDGADMNYARGAKVWHNGKAWTSLVDNNNVEPTVANAAFWSDFEYFDKQVAQNDPRVWTSYTTAQRATFTNYTNTESHAITVSVYDDVFLSLNRNGRVELFIDGVSRQRYSSVTNASAGGILFTVFADVPAGSTYRVEIDQSTAGGTNRVWSEFR